MTSSPNTASPGCTTTAAHHSATPAGTTSRRPLDDIEEMLEDGASKDAIVLYLHEIASDIDEEEEHKRQWRIRHPIIYAINRLGWHLQMVGRRQWREHWQ